jgi:Ser/Thr protein kinase RdoA (MazF antagonist)
MASAPPYYRLIRRLGQPRSDRIIWQADTEYGAATIKTLTNPFATQKLDWLQRALDVLQSRRYPVPRILWQGQVAENTYVVVQAWLPGGPATHLGTALLEALLELIELHADVDAGLGGWDVSEWVDNVVFDEWEGWWQSAHAAAPKLADRLRAFAEPARGRRLPGNDLVHHDFNLSNVLVEGATVRGVVDWDDAGHGCRAQDLATLLFEWHRLAELGASVSPDGPRRLADRIVELAGERGLRLVVTYRAIALLALTSRRSENEALSVWCRVIPALLARLN